jgi:hypothetical protein
VELPQQQHRVIAGSFCELGKDQSKLTNSSDAKRTKGGKKLRGMTSESREIWCGTHRAGLQGFLKVRRQSGKKLNHKIQTQRNSIWEQRSQIGTGSKEFVRGQVDPMARSRVVA